MPERRVSTQLKRAVEERAGGCCEYCRGQARLAMHSFSAEHIVPRVKGGETTIENLAFACQGCNGHKYTKTESPDPVTGKSVSLFHPRQNNWSGHFAWSNDFTHIRGLTPTGRATIGALKLNRQELVTLRRILYAAGEHPPM